MSPNAPLTDNQRNAITEMRTAFAGSPGPKRLGTTESVDERARRPDPESIPADVTVRIEIAPPSPQPHFLLNSRLLKKPERVPIYFYALCSGDPKCDSTAKVATTRVLFFVHGGGNVNGHPTDRAFIEFYTQLLRAVASDSGDVDCVLIAPSYRLATVPENVFPAALQDLVAAYDFVLSNGYDPSNIVIAGDSAGGNHAVVLTHLVLQSNRPSPCGVVTLAPYAMQAHDRMSAHALAQVDRDVLTVHGCEQMACAYVGDSGVSPADPLVSGAFLTFTASWPRTLIIVGTGDILIDGAHELAKRLAALDGRTVELVEYSERPHEWWVMPHVFPENVQDTVQRIARFIHDSGK